MAAFSGQILTQKGIALLAKAMTGSPLTFSKIKVGDGELGGSLPVELTDLKHVVKTLEITSMLDVVSGSAYFSGNLSNQDLVSGFYWRETGLYALDPQAGEILFSYAYCPAAPQYIPAKDGPTVFEQVVKLQAIYGSAQNVSAVINQSLVYASAAELNALAAQVAAGSTMTDPSTNQKYIMGVLDGKLYYKVVV